MLTPRQHDLLVFIDTHIRDRGCAPAVREMGEALGLKSLNSVHLLLSSLETRGFIRRLRHRARAIEVVRLPDGKLNIAAEAVAAIKLRKKARDVGLLAGAELWAAADRAEDAVLAKLEADHG
ncbi:LexA family protein [Ancylobacter sp. IITR112]|uniref:LexA family protein n=1 Tax=Ancylobacter sp. IITR112 TaxID=3138073 RepID=UPI00352A3CC2